MTATTSISLPGSDPIDPTSRGTEVLRSALASTPATELPELTVALAGLAPLPATLDHPLTVAEAAELLALSPHTLRYYERIGLVEVPRDAGGHRAYDLPSLSRLVFITRLRLTGMPVRVIASYFELTREGIGTEPQRLALLTEHRAALRRHLHELQFALAVIDYKIATYGGSSDCVVASADD
ncbi:MerR family transcriptional regulator [Nakamurella sp. A5-74]|uniref:MerR family transcriptional regulator n=1 Tax=Nakamurella sp. A5-74 TaxID=3158264 RepID=A0AAU8DSP5_9ACTN